jgi:hypothetical protein
MWICFPALSKVLPYKRNDSHGGSSNKETSPKATTTPNHNSGDKEPKKGFKMHRRQKTVTGGVLVGNSTGSGSTGDQMIAPVQLEIPTNNFNKVSSLDSRSGSSPKRSYHGLYPNLIW